MTVYETGGRGARGRRRARVPAGRAPRRRPPASGRRAIWRASASARSCSPTGTRITSAALPYLLREVDVDDRVATRLTLGLIKSKLDEHGLGQAAELVEADPEDDPLELGPFRRRARPGGALDPRLRSRSSSRRRGPRRAHGRLEARPHAGGRAARRTSASSPRSGIAASTSCSATRRTPSGPGTTGSERLVGEAFRTLFPLRTRQDPRRVVRVEHPPHAAGRRRRDRVRPQGHRRRALDAQEPEHRAESRLRRDPRGRDRQPERGRRAPARTRSSRCARGARASRCPR